MRDHVALSTAGAAVLAPLLGWQVLPAWAASILIDIDHYLWFLARRRRLSPLAAIRLFNQPEPPGQWATRSLHHPAALLAVGLVAARLRRLRPLALGMGFHVALDTYHRRQLRAGREDALRRAGHTCQRCWHQGEDVRAHQWRQRLLLPSHRAGDFIALCPTCHLAAHQRGLPAARRAGAAVSGPGGGSAGVTDGRPG
ncbi:MAG: hypothetical protein WBU92_01725 [Candidatus Dormiibacterota bacterium]